MESIKYFENKFQAEATLKRINNRRAGKIYYLDNGEYSPPDYKIIKRSKGYVIFKINYYYANTLNPAQNHALTGEEIEYLIR